MDYLFWGHASVWLFIAAYALYLKKSSDNLSRKLNELKNKD